MWFDRQSLSCLLLRAHPDRSTKQMPKSAKSSAVKWIASDTVSLDDSQQVLPKIEEDLRLLGIEPLSVDPHIYIVDKSGEASQIIDVIVGYLGIDSIRILGFDTETKIRRVGAQDSSRDKTSTIQIAFSESIAVVFQIFRMCWERDPTNKLFRKRLPDGSFEMRPSFCFSHTNIPQNLKGLLENNAIVKTGVSASKDAETLLAHYNIKVSNLVDLDVAVKPFRLPRSSLGALAYMYCDGAILDKSNSNLLSNWDAPPSELTLECIRYAAEDAMYGLRIYNRLFRLPCSSGSPPASHAARMSGIKRGQQETVARQDPDSGSLKKRKKAKSSQ
ncbi:ribonuclease H-like domain-containing protein [Polychytrium aggregatum]|uniref:ribonuclease H-like domain-containing protein n=1 Tax=Polychytrium aggregatum TaxID=110093 RepID=UPI0022FF0814|nr:ribonuclease H-like domain-containing protein [Polychytrium aggregatum]KAI9209423.1 ribonuclease H-like domain-containing protein [Polychytrium aggregatum]